MEVVTVQVDSFWSPVPSPILPRVSGVPSSLGGPDDSKGKGSGVYVPRSLSRVWKRTSFCTFRYSQSFAFIPPYLCVDGRTPCPCTVPGLGYVGEETPLPHDLVHRGGWYGWAVGRTYAVEPEEVGHHLRGLHEPLLES